jgi:flagellar hook-associated protein 1 FlgK
VSLNIGKVALSNSQIALDVVGKNIAHANDEHYARARVHVTSTHNGTTIQRVEQAVNESLEKDILREKGQLGFYEKQEEVLTQIEYSINELSDSDLSSSLDDYYDSLEKLTLEPHDIALRQTVVQAANQVTDTFHAISNSLTNLDERVDQEINDHGDVINSILERIADLNIEVARREGGVSDDPAVDMRDQRRGLLNDLSSMVNITTTELSNGSVLVQSDGRTLVFQGEDRGVYVDRNDGYTRLRYTSDHAYVEPSGGTLGGLITTREDILNVRRDDLDELAANFIWQSNQVHSTGRGLNGLTSVQAETKVDLNFIDKSLDIAVVDAFSPGAKFKPENGTLTLEVKNEVSGDITEATISVTLVGDNPTTLKDLSEQLQQVAHLSSDIDHYGRLSIDSESGYSFFISEDTSNVTSFLGINSLFSGNGAASIELNEEIADDPSMFAAAKSDAPGDNSNLQTLIATRDAELSDGQTFFSHYETFVSSVASQINRVTSLSDNQERIVQDVVAQRNAFSGVNLDEEAANLLRYQQSYQAAAQYVSVQNQLINILMEMI